MRAGTPREKQRPDGTLQYKFTCRPEYLVWSDQIEAAVRAVEQLALPVARARYRAAIGRLEALKQATLAREVPADAAG